MASVSRGLAAAPLRSALRHRRGCPPASVTSDRLPNRPHDGVVGVARHSVAAAAVHCTFHCGALLLAIDCSGIAQAQTMDEAASAMPSDITRGPSMISFRPRPVLPCDAMAVRAGTL